MRAERVKAVSVVSTKKNGDKTHVASVVLTVKRFEGLTTDELYRVLELRSEVFVVEQNCVYQDLDGKDRHAWHLLLERGDELVAYARVLDIGVSYDGAASIGRVVSRYHGQGHGATVTAAAVQVARERYSNTAVVISAQQYAAGFYERFGFRQTSAAYLEDGIPHVKMILNDEELS